MNNDTELLRQKKIIKKKKKSPSCPPFPLHAVLHVYHSLNSYASSEKTEHKFQYYFCYDLIILC